MDWFLRLAPKSPAIDRQKVLRCQFPIRAHQPAQAGTGALDGAQYLGHGAGRDDQFRTAGTLARHAEKLHGYGCRQGHVLLPSLGAEKA
jgi:hypothetical protein